MIVSLRSYSISVTKLYIKSSYSKQDKNDSFDMIIDHTIIENHFVYWIISVVSRIMCPG